MVETVGPNEVCQRSAVAVGPVLRRIGLQRDPLTEQGGLCELRGLLLRLGCIDTQDSHTEPAPDIVANVDRVAVDDAKDLGGGDDDIGDCAHRR